MELIGPDVCVSLTECVINGVEVLDVEDRTYVLRAVVSKVCVSGGSWSYVLEDVWCVFPKREKYERPESVFECGQEARRSSDDRVKE